MGCFGCIEQICGFFECIMNSEKLIWIKKTRIRLTIGKEYENCFIRSGSGKYLLLLITKKQKYSSHWSVFDNMREVKIAVSKGKWKTRKQT